MKYKIQIIKRGSKYWWRLKRKTNGRIIATSETYRSRRNCEDTVEELNKILNCEVVRICLTK
jgi:uncharacterized protein YegP (UPF0339 family)